MGRLSKHVLAEKQIGAPSVKNVEGLKRLNRRTAYASTVQLQFIKRAPIRFRLAVLGMGFHFRRFADMPAIAVAAWIRRQIEQNIFSHKRSDIDRLRPVQFSMKGECWDLDFVLELFETSHTRQLHRLRNCSIRP